MILQQRGSVTALLLLALFRLLASRRSLRRSAFLLSTALRWRFVLVGIIVVVVLFFGLLILIIVVLLWRGFTGVPPHCVRDDLVAEGTTNLVVVLHDILQEGILVHVLFVHIHALEVDIVRHWLTRLEGPEETTKERISGLFTFFALLFRFLR